MLRQVVPSADGIVDLRSQFSALPEDDPDAAPEDELPELLLAVLPELLLAVVPELLLVLAAPLLDEPSVPLEELLDVSHGCAAAVSVPGVAVWPPRADAVALKPEVASAAEAPAVEVAHPPDEEELLEEPPEELLEPSCDSIQASRCSSCLSCRCSCWSSWSSLLSLRRSFATSAVSPAALAC